MDFKLDGEGVMAIPEDRMSTTVVPAAYLSPDERFHTSHQDYEKGPVALNDPSEGLSYQVWKLEWIPGSSDFIATPETVGSPQTIINVPGVTFCSLAFDNNGHITIAYMTSGGAYLYWYDTLQAGWVTDTLDVGTTYPMLQLDDKRTTQTDSNDIMLWYTKQQPDLTWNLYKREQRERFLIEDLMITDTYPYLFKVGMHSGLRSQITLRSAPY